MNTKNTLTKQDFIKWGKDTVVFCLLPSAIAFLQAFQTGDFHFALGASQTALIASLLNLLTKYAAGVETKEANVESRVNETQSTISA